MNKDIKVNGKVVGCIVDEITIEPNGEENFRFLVCINEEIKVSEHTNRFKTFEVLEKYLDWLLGEDWILDDQIHIKPEKKKEKTFQMRISQDLDDKILRESQIEGMNKSEFVEFCIREHIRESERMRADVLYQYRKIGG